MSRHGFTLIEVLVVVAIIGILASIVIGSLNSSKDKARVAVAKSQLKDVERAFVSFYLSKGDYPPLPLHSDFCSYCHYYAPASPWENGNWATDIEGQLIANGDIKTGFGLDPWGRPYSYDKNYEQQTTGGCWAWSPICSLGPNGIAETVNCQPTTTTPVVGGDDICVFIPDP